MAFSEFDTVLKDIMCGKHQDMCCLLPIIDKVDYWLKHFGKERTVQLLELACVCRAQEPPPEPPTPQPDQPPKEEKKVQACPEAIPAKGAVE